MAKKESVETLASGLKKLACRLQVNAGAIDVHMPHVGSQKR